MYLSFCDLEVVHHEDCAYTCYARCAEEDLALEGHDEVMGGRKSAKTGTLLAFIDDRVQSGRNDAE